MKNQCFLRMLAALVAASFFTACSHSQRPQEPVGRPASSSLFLWKKTDCGDLLTVPTNIKENFICLQTVSAFCAFFPNGRPYYCHTADGALEHRLNQWGSSLTVTLDEENGKPQKEDYYADGKLARVTEYDYKNNTKSVLYLDGSQIRLYQYFLPNNAVINKYYFRPGMPYVRYPDGNDMGEINGEWKEKDGQIFLDGKPFWPLPQNTAAPDTCEVFKGACNYDLKKQ